MKKVLSYLPAILFIGFIFVMMVLWLVLPKESYSPQEKRVLADFPELTTETLLNGDFQKELDTYLSDHMPARNFFVGLNADYDLLSGRNGAKGIYLGQDGYLFPKPERNDENLEKNAGFIKEFAEDLDIPVYMTVIPSSGSINSEKLPWNHEEYTDRFLIDLFYYWLGEKVTTVDVFQTFAEITAGRQIYHESDGRYAAFTDNAPQLYYKTDHHWTSRGAYECYRILGKTLGYEPLSEQDFSIETIADFYGTSYAKAALWFLSPDTIELWSNKNQSDNAVKVEIKDGKESKSGDSYFFREQLDNDDKYPVFLDGNHSLVRVTNDDVPEGTLVVVKDSYAHTIVPFLSQHYHTIIMADLRYYKKEISALAKDEQADAVLFLYSLDDLTADTNLSYLF